MATGDNVSTSGTEVSSADQKLLSLGEELDKAFDDAGGFEDEASFEREPAPTTDTTKLATGTTTQAAAPGATVEKAADAAPAPLEHWSQEEKTAFTKAPVDVQKIWIDRERQIERGLQEKFAEVAGFKRESEELNEIFTPYAQDMKLAGTTRAQAIRQLVAAHDFLQKDPIKGLAWLAQTYGVDPTKLPDLLAQTSAQTDPKVAQLERELNELRGTMTGVTTAQRETAHADHLRVVTSFAEEADAQGNLAHPHFNDVAADVLLLIKGGERDLKQAYDKACWMNSGVRLKINATEQAANIRNMNGVVDKAKRAGFSVESTATEQPGKPKDLRAELAAGFGF